MSWEKQNLKANLGFSLSGGFFFFFLMRFLRVISFSFECGLKIRFR